MALHDPLLADRCATLAELALLDTPEEAEFQSAVLLARQIFDCPIAMVSLVDRHRQWFKARCGLEARQVPREHAFCAHAVLSDEVMVIEDAAADPRFSANPLVIGAEGVRFYAGAPLRPTGAGTDAAGPAIGTLCLIDTAPRRFGPEARLQLARLAGLVDGLIRARAAAAATLRLSREVQADAAVIARKNRQLRQAERMAGIGSWRLSLADASVEWSDQVFAIHDMPVGPAPTRAAALAFYPPADRARIAALIDDAVATGAPFTFESALISATGARKYVRGSGEVERSEAGPIAVVGVFQDMTERHRYELELKHSASTDSLTGLANRAEFEAHLDEAVAQAPGTPLALLLIDLDGFKPINDNHGHEAGDAVLRRVGEVLRGPGMGQNFTARLGGDEFVLLVRRPRDCAALPALVQTVLRALRQMVTQDGARRIVTATVGAVLAEAPIAGSELLRRADLALYAAKRAERGTGRLYGTDTVIRPWGEAPAVPMLKRG
ncbi:sensor domain-containing diguanylate cyclase [Sphingomonas morindae]|uniref:Sensor domain-containing diguanylate cyclase n=1 Tax=Sphingomonas morindae TaxID=1541170 RepID=A0ABY4X8L2_9SPHN|nr:sensor domain-containing diguanylate cyclase [Sphingomonas morindae]USI72995.1 sensor domain-containing diguanylate cyclase [Sphingomonas morindae]